MKSIAIIITLVGSLFLSTPVDAFSIQSSATLNGPSQVIQGLMSSITTKVQTNQPKEVLVDTEIYDPTGKKMLQDFHVVNTNATCTWNLFMPNGLNGTWKIKVGIFAKDWSQLYSWNNNAGSFTLGPGMMNIFRPPLALSACSSYSNPSRGKL